MSILTMSTQLRLLCCVWELCVALLADSHLLLLLCIELRSLLLLLLGHVLLTLGSGLASIAAAHLGEGGKSRKGEEKGKQSGRGCWMK